VIKRCYTVFCALPTKLPTAILYSFDYIFIKLCHQILQYYDHRKQAFMCQSNPAFLCALLKSSTNKHATNQTQTCRKCFHRVQVTYVQAIPRAVPSIPSVILLLEKVTPTSDILGIEAEHNTFFAPIS